MPRWLGGGYAILRRRFRDKMFSFQEAETLLHRLGYSPTAVKKLLSLLSKYGWLKREGRGNYVLGGVEDIVTQIALRQIAERVSEELRRIDGLHSILLIGSVADGTATSESDVDLVVLTDRESIKEVENVIYSAPFCSDSPLLITPKEFTSELKRGNPNIVSYLIKGKVLYDDGLVTRLRRRDWKINAKYAGDWIKEAGASLEFVTKRGRKRPEAYVRILMGLVRSDLVLHGEYVGSMRKMAKLFQRLHPGIGSRGIDLISSYKRGMAVPGKEAADLERCVREVVEEVKEEWTGEIGGRTTREPWLASRQV